MGCGRASGEQAGTGHPRRLVANRRASTRPQPPQPPPQARTCSGSSRASSASTGASACSAARSSGESTLHRWHGCGGWAGQPAVCLEGQGSPPHRPHAPDPQAAGPETPRERSAGKWAGWDQAAAACSQNARQQRAPEGGRNLAPRLHPVLGARVAHRAHRGLLWGAGRVAEGWVPLLGWPRKRWLCGAQPERQACSCACGPHPAPPTCSAPNCASASASAGASAAGQGAAMSAGPVCGVACARRAAWGARACSVEGPGAG